MNDVVLEPSRLAASPIVPDELRLELLYRTVARLNEIGIVTRVVTVADGFFPHVRIVAGELRLNSQCLVSDLCHEAGHLAIIPRRYRHLADGDLNLVNRYMLEEMSNLELVDTPIFRAVNQCTDPEATAWAWALGKSLGIPDEILIQDDQYPDDDHKGTGAEIRAALNARAYFGINGLANAGFCSTNRFGRLPVYPQLAFWTQEL